MPTVRQVVVLPCAGLLGALLAEIEGWSIADGYLYVISNLTGLGECTRWAWRIRGCRCRCRCG